MLRGRKLDYVMDEWYYIPISWGQLGTSDQKSFYYGSKWINIIECSRIGLLNDGCKLIIPMHARAVRFLLTPLEYMKREQCAWLRFIGAKFEPSFLTKGDLEQNPHENPLWGATQAPEAMKTALDNDDTIKSIKDSVRDWLRVYFKRGGPMKFQRKRGMWVP